MRHFQPGGPLRPRGDDTRSPSGGDDGDAVVVTAGESGSLLPQPWNIVAAAVVGIVVHTRPLLLLLRGAGVVEQIVACGGRGGAVEQCGGGGGGAG